MDTVTTYLKEFASVTLPAWYEKAKVFHTEYPTTFGFIAGFIVALIVRMFI